jgi:hypothetical protein
MKKVVLVCFAILAGIFGLLAVVNVFYNAAGLFHVQDAASGSTWELILAALLLLSLASGAFYLCYWLLRRFNTLRLGPPRIHDSM